MSWEDYARQSWDYYVDDPPLHSRQLDVSDEDTGFYDPKYAYEFGGRPTASVYRINKDTKERVNIVEPTASTGSPWWQIGGPEFWGSTLAGSGQDSAQVVSSGGAPVTLAGTGVRQSVGSSATAATSVAGNASPGRSLGFYVAIAAVVGVAYMVVK